MSCYQANQFDEAIDFFRKNENTKKDISITT